MNTIFLQWQKKINITKWTCKKLKSCVKAAMTICSVYKARYWLNFCYDIYLWNIKLLDSTFGNYKLVYWSVENYTYWKLFSEKTTIESMTLCHTNLNSINLQNFFFHSRPFCAGLELMPFDYTRITVTLPPLFIFFVWKKKTKCFSYIKQRKVADLISLSEFLSLIGG